jgi:hypothetical protein
MLELSTTLSAPSFFLDTPITLLRARATTLSFSLLPTPSRDRDATTNEQDGEDTDEEEREADPDVLPTILAYKDGELQRKWIRVDWDIGEGSLETLLRRFVCLSNIQGASKAVWLTGSTVKGSCPKKASTIAYRADR